MGYLDGSTITVDAVLTKYGRRLLSRGTALGINSFCLSDTGIDYNLWNTDHPSGSAFYGEAIEKTYLPPIRVYAQVTWGGSTTEFTKYGVDRRVKITVSFHKRRLTEDQDLYVRVGDFVKFGDFDYEIAELAEPKLLFGQTDKSFEISATCIMAREGKFKP